MSNMQITINIRYTGKNNSVKYFLQEMKESGTIDAIRAEDLASDDRFVRK